jgi:hypothetical protein
MSVMPTIRRLLDATCLPIPDRTEAEEQKRCEVYSRRVESFPLGVRTRNADVRMALSPEASTQPPPSA